MHADIDVHHILLVQFQRDNEITVIDRPIVKRPLVAHAQIDAVAVAELLVDIDVVQHGIADFQLLADGVRSVVVQAEAKPVAGTGVTEIDAVDNVDGALPFTVPCGFLHFVDSKRAAGIHQVFDMMRQVELVAVVVQHDGGGSGECNAGMAPCQHQAKYQLPSSRVQNTFGHSFFSRHGFAAGCPL